MISPVRTIGFVGAGQLGEPTVLRLLGAGHRVRLYARREEVRSRLAEQGATLVDAAAAVAADADLVIVFVFSDGQLREVTLGPGGLLPAMTAGTPLVLHTTASLQTLDALASAAAPAGVPILDAPVSGTAEEIAAGELTVLVGGEPTAVAAATEVFRAYADPVVATGSLGSAMKTKLVNNLLFAANLQLVGDAARLAGALGIDTSAVFTALSVSSSGSKAMGYLLRFGALEALASSAAPYLRKDVEAARLAAEQLGVDLGLLGDVAKRGPLDLA
jgi:3-hydroxyisobutyrate dehydrogenase-like beta-hydroxyacid dehydrogenase